MRPAFAFLLVFPAFLFAGPADVALQNAVTIRSEGGQGSGVAVKHKGKVYYLTAAHVVAANMQARTVPFTDGAGRRFDVVDPTPRPVECLTRDGRKHMAKVVWYSAGWREDAGPDLALLDPEGDYGLPGADLLDGDPEVGEDVWYCGTPAGLPFVLEKSIVSRLDERYMTVNGNGWYGNSGSGVYVVRKGKLVVAGILVQFASDPGRNPRSPMECERGLRKFLSTFDPPRMERVP